MKSYSQNSEDLFVLNYFGYFKGTLVEIGANDGLTLSNSRLLIENGWKAHLLEPASVFGELSTLYAKNKKVSCYNYGIGEHDEVVPFYESGAHVSGGSDQALVSSCDYAETERWRKNGVQFTEKNIQLVTWDTFSGSRNQFDFISIDVEGLDVMVLKQIDLSAVKCKCLCIEWNGNQGVKKEIYDYCRSFGMRLDVQNRENLIFTI